MKYSREQGFSLLEVLVAFSILALSLGVLMRVFSISVQNAELAHDQAQAVLLAQSLMDEAGVSALLTPGEISGEAGNMRWSLMAQPVQDEQALVAPSQPTLITPGSVELWEVVVNVRWGEFPGEVGRHVTLSSLRVQKRAMP